MLTARDGYTAAERWADAAIHCVGVALALMGAPVLVVVCVLLDGSPGVVAATAIYALAMLAMFVASAAYHLSPVETWRELLRRFDHSAIYLKIAATQTPFAVMMGGGKAGWFLGALWLVAALGAAGKMLAPARMRRISLPLYLLMGWAGVAIFAPGADGAALATATVVLVVCGGLLYSAGVPFFLWRGLRYHNAIWHGFVLVATFVFYSAVLTELGIRAAHG